MAAETGFLIDGTKYEMPTLGSLTMDESEALYERCGLVREDFVQTAEETDDEWDERTNKLMRHPGFWTVLMQIAYQRGNPTVKPDQVRLMIGATNTQEAMSGLAGAEEEPDETPLASTSEPSESSKSGSLENDSSSKDSSANGGNASTNGSEEPAAVPPPITASRSATSSVLGHEISAA